MVSSMSLWVKINIDHWLSITEGDWKMKKGNGKRRNAAILICTVFSLFLLSAFSTASACDGDFGGDGDVDGEDLYTYIMNGDFSDVGAFAAEFGKADCEPAPTGLLVDPDFEASVDSADLRADGVGRDWYESRNDVPTLLFLDETEVGGRGGKKAGFTGSASGSAYVSQAFSTAQTGIFAVEWDIYVDEILDISGSPDRGAWMMIGDDSVGTDGPNATDNERFVLMAFTKNGGGTTGTMALVARDRDDDWTSFTPVAIGLNMDQWYRISVVCDLDADTYAVFVNGEYRLTVTSRLVKDSLTHISFATSSLGAGSFYVDNVQEASLVEVPNSLAIAEADARDDIVAAGLVAGATTTAFHDDIEAGHVISTTPAGGTRVPLGATVALLVSDGPAPVSVPGVVGDDQATAVGSIEALGLVANVTTAHSDTVAEGLVISQNPVGGTGVAPGSTVDVVVSLGPAPVSVPDVVGNDQATAVGSIEALGLVANVTTAHSDTVAEGLVISQNPVGGTGVAPGSTVDVVVSLGPAPVSVPDVVGNDQATAVGSIEALGLVANVTTAYSDTVAEGLVISQDPVGDTGVAPGSAVTVSVSLGPAPVSVPDVVGNDQATAVTAIQAQGLVANVTTAHSDTVSAGFVISQDPVGGTGVAPGSTVDVAVSLGPAPVSVPDVVGNDQATAVGSIEALGLVANVTTDYSETVMAGLVISQDPVGGTGVAPGSTVKVFVSLGPAPTELITDTDFEASFDNADLRADGLGHDWYESNGGDPTLLFLDETDVGGNTSKKAGFSGSASGSAYLTQEFSTVQTGTIAVSLHIYIDRVEDSDGYDRTGNIFVGDDRFTTDGPTGASDERFVFLGFYDATPGDTGDDLEIRARTSSSQALNNTSEWTLAASGLSYDIWHTIQLVVKTTSGQYDLYVDGELKSHGIPKYSGFTASALTHISFAADGNARGDFYVDNTLGDAGPILSLPPDTVGSSQTDAEAVIQAQGFTVGSITSIQSDIVPVGNVMSQYPTADVLLLPGTAVDLVVSLGPVAMAVPNLESLEQSVAEAVINAIGLTVGTLTGQFDETVPADHVISQDPAAGTLVAPGTAVDLVVSSSGTEQVTMPAVVGLSQSEAEAAIAAAGLVVGSEIQTYTPNVPPGDVVSTVPPAGTLIPTGSPVTMVTNVIPVIVDNGSTDTFAVGTWQESSAPNPYNGTSLYGNGGATYTWRLTAPVSGYFNVSIWYTALSSRNTNAEVRIEHADGITSKYVDQTQNGGKWNSLGSFRYDEGETYEVTIIAAGSLSTCADAVRFTKENILRHKWTTRLPGGGQIMPVMGDIDNDGDQEIVMNAGTNIVAINGKTGAIEWSVGGSAGTSIELADLNKDGVPEVLYGMDGPRLRALNGNGTTRWTSPYLKGEGQARYPILSYDIDGDGYPTIWFASEDSHPDPFNGDMNDYNGALIMLDHNGTVLTDTWIHHPCWGGMALADTDNDGQYEIYLSDRGYGYHDFPANGIQAFNAHTLDPIWARPDIHHSSPLPVIADVDRDGDLEIVATKITYAGPIILDPATGETIVDYSWKWLPTHGTPTVYDIDEDGNLEYIVSTSYPSIVPKKLVVFDLTTGNIDFTATFSDFWIAWPPSVGDVTGDGHMEILVASGSQEEEVGDTRDGDYPLIVYDKNFTMIDWVEIIDAGQLTPARVYDTDGDGYSEVVVAGHNGMLLVFDTDSPTPNPAPRSWVQYYSEYRQGAALYVHPPVP